MDFGAGASSYINNIRYTNEQDIEKYIIDLEKYHIDEVQTANQKIDEYMLLQLRLINGIDVEKSNKKFGIDILERYKDKLNKLQKLGLIEVNNNIKLTRLGLDLANLVWQEFV